MANTRTIKSVGGKVKTTIRLPEALYWKLQEVKTAKRISSDEVIYAAAVELWLAETNSSSKVTMPEAPTNDPSEINSTNPSEGVRLLPELSRNVVAILAIVKQNGKALRDLARRTTTPSKPDQIVAATRARIRQLDKEALRLEKEVVPKAPGPTRKSAG